LFGATFVVTRLIYNAYLAYQLACISPSGMIWKVCCIVLLVHIYWFYKWCIIYGYKALSQLMK